MAAQSLNEIIDRATGGFSGPMSPAPDNAPGAMQFSDGGRATMMPPSIPSMPRSTTATNTGTPGTAPTPGVTPTPQLFDDVLSRLNTLKSERDAGEPTIGQSFSSPEFQPGMSFEEIYGEEPDEEAVRRNTLKLFQGQIDATNQVYDQLLNEARMEGQGRLGSQRAMAARGGLLGSDFGASQKQKVQNFNTDVNRAIQAERTAKIGQIMGTVRSAVTAELAEKRAARQQGAENYLSYLKTEAERKQGNVNLAATALLTQGIDPTELDENELGAIALEAGTTPQNIIAAYQVAKKAGSDSDQFTLSEGEQRYDADGNLIATGPEDTGSWTVYSTSAGLVRVNPQTGETQQLTNTGSGGGSSSGVSFTPTEKKKLEQAGLTDAPRQQQLDFLYGKDSTDEFTLNTAREWATSNMDIGRDAIRNELIAGGLSATLADGVLSEVGLGKDTNVLSQDQFTNNVSKLAESLRKAAASWSNSSEEELEIARAQVEKGRLRISGKDYVLTPTQKQQLLAEMDTIGPRSFIERALPGGS